ncbi:transglycosylase domain-containing protein [Nocardioides donggukensis]|uniref:transglycosylase domain-containing protein n=1 Tax=Nocardioides donggukensis TaxID=2774019 RepID=UPI00191F0950|nr:transglycosylase domain-containing protein [Nocardioides donggukensis]
MTGKRKAATPASPTPRKASAKGKGAKGGTGGNRFRRVLKWAGISGLVLAVMAALGFTVLYQAIDIPDPNEDFQTETSFVYYADDKTEVGRFTTQNRSSIPYSEMPDSIKDAVVAAEDRSFWTNKGIDPRGILRAAFSNASGQAQQGASTITQQYVKILYLTQERSYKRKAKEAIVSLKLQRQTSKEEILAGYLNTIYFGRGAYGIQAAAQAFFAKDAGELNLRQSAALAAVINNPSRFDPANGKDSREALKGRFTYTLDGMAEMGEVPAEKADKAARKLPKFPKIEAESSYAGMKGHALTMIEKELKRLGFSDNEINGGGLKVYTTLSKKAMDATQAAVDEVQPKGLKGLHTATASVQPGTGALRGFYAGQDYLDSQINWAVSGGQPGSSFKPFALAAGLEAGYALKDRFQGNSPYEFPNGDTVKNLGPGEGNDYGDQIDMIKATVSSVNTAYVDLTASIPDGPEKVVEMANKLGIPKAKAKDKSLDNLRDSPGLQPTSGVALGSATVSPINMANAYATIANGGEAAEVYLIDRVVDRSGEERYRHKVSTERVLDKDIAADVSYALQQVVDAEGGSGAKAQALGRPAAGKTGTATNADDQVSSAWFVGYTPQMATAVMYSRGKGNESLEGFLEPFFGGTYPALTWVATMQRLLEGVPVEEFPEPAFVDGDAPEEDHEPYTPPPPPPTTSQPSPTKAPSSKKPSPTPTPTPTPTPSPTKTKGPDCEKNPENPQCVLTPDPEPSESQTTDGQAAGRETESAGG